MADKFEGELTPEDITDLFNDFHTLRDFVEELTGVLYDNADLSHELQHEIQSLYIKKFG